MGEVSASQRMDGANDAEASTCGGQGVIPEESSSCGVNEFVATALEPVIEETDSFVEADLNHGQSEHKEDEVKATEAPNPVGEHPSDQEVLPAAEQPSEVAGDAETTGVEVAGDAETTGVEVAGDAETTGVEVARDAETTSVEVAGHAETTGVEVAGDAENDVVKCSLPKADADVQGSEDNTAPLDVSDAQNLLCEDLPRAEISQAEKDEDEEPTHDDAFPELPLTSETVLLPGSPSGLRSPSSGIPEAVFHEVPLMPPESFFDPVALERLKDEAMAEYSELLAWLLGPFQTKDPEKSLRRHQEQEEEEAEYRSQVLHVARRQMWRERSKILKQQKDVVLLNEKDEEEMIRLQSQLADMKEEASALVETIDERKEELVEIRKQQQELRGEISTWSARVTDLEARAVDARMKAAPAQAPAIFRAESLPVLGAAPVPMGYPSRIPAWAQRTYIPSPPMSTPSPVPHQSPLATPATIGSSPGLISPGRIAGVSSPGGIGSPPTRVVWSPRSPWSPGSALLPPRSPGTTAPCRTGSLLVPAGSMQLPPQQAKAPPMPMTARMISSFSTGQLPKMMATVQAPQSPVRPGGGAPTPCSSFRLSSPVRVPL